MLVIHVDRRGTRDFGLMSIEGYKKRMGSVGRRYVSLCGRVVAAVF